MAELSHTALLAQLIARKHLTSDQARWAFDQIMEGVWTEAQIGGFLVALAAKGETVAEYAGAAAAMRAHVVPVDTGGAEVVDTCGTGGTGISTFNISTAAGFVAAGAGVKIAKHGNRTNTRASGSANVLAALGVNIECDAATESRCLAEAGMCFSFALTHHPAMRFAGPVRKQLGVRTIFNLLGPLTNPAGATRQVMGVPRADLTMTVAGVLRDLGAVRALVVHSADGLDEISTTAPAKGVEVRNGATILHDIDTTKLDLPRARLEDLLVDSPAQSAEVIRDVLAGRHGPARDIVVVNAAAAIMVGGAADSLADGVAKAADSLDAGAGADVLARMVEITNA